MEITKEQEKRILALDPNFFKVELEIGKWYCYRNKNTYWIMNYQKGGNNCYGFNSIKDYGNCYVMNSGTNWIPATHQEVENALISEAKKRGFKAGVFVKRAGINKDAFNLSIPIDSFIYREENNGLDRKNCSGWIFKNGKWAEIIETITKAEAEKLLNKIII